MVVVHVVDVYEHSDVQPALCAGIHVLGGNFAFPGIVNRLCVMIYMFGSHTVRHSDLRSLVSDRFTDVIINKPQSSVSTLMLTNKNSVTLYGWECASKVVENRLCSSLFLNKVSHSGNTCR